jgi:hypothetical protein
VARNVGRGSLSEAHVIGIMLLDGIISGVTVCRPVQRRRRVESFAVHDSEAIVARNVGRRSVPEAHVIRNRLLDGMVSEVTVFRPIQRRRRVESFAVHISEATMARNVGRRSLPEAHVIYVGYLAGVVTTMTVWRSLR